MLSRLRFYRNDLLALAGVVILLLALQFLPPDTSLAQVEKAGVLSACVPAAYPPLVTGDPARPGMDIEILQAIASDMGLRLNLNTVQGMVRDFNPKGWHVTRAQCQVLAGGVVATPQTRSFMETSAPYAETGWAFVEPNGAPPAGAPLKLGVLVGISGLDRLALSRQLRAIGAMATIVTSPDDLMEGLMAGRFDAGVGEALQLSALAATHDWPVMWLAGNLPRFPVAIGLWKGDLSLKRRIAASLEHLSTDGTLAAIEARYIGDSTPASTALLAGDPAD